MRETRGWIRQHWIHHARRGGEDVDAAYEIGGSQRDKAIDHSRVIPGPVSTVFDDPIVVSCSGLGSEPPHAHSTSQNVVDCRCVRVFVGRAGARC